jgi:hypothetical protein
VQKEYISPGVYFFALLPKDTPPLDMAPSEYDVNEADTGGGRSGLLEKSLCGCVAISTAIQTNQNQSLKAASILLYIGIIAISLQEEVTRHKPSP